MISVEAQYSKHDGGTKFYQVFKIYNDESRVGVVVQHWGKIIDGKELPRHHGQVKMTSGDTPGIIAEIYRKPKAEKRKRGYGIFTESVHMQSISATSSKSIILDLQNWFTGEQAARIYAMMSGLSEDDEVEDAMSEEELAELKRQQEQERIAYEENKRKEEERLEQERQARAAAKQENTIWGSW